MESGGKSKVSKSKKNKMTNRKRDRDNLDDGMRNDQHTTLQVEGDKTSRIELQLREIEECTKHWDRVKSENIRDVLISHKEFIFGNYDRFYYNRFLEAVKDPRLGAFKSDWFKDKKCLDIGCNDGTLTITLAVYHSPQIIEGIDLDYRLVKKAIKNVKHVMRNNLSKEVIEGISSGTNLAETRTQEIISKINTMPKSFLLNMGETNLMSKLEKLSKVRIDNKDGIVNLSKNIFFMQTNYVSELKEGEKYDTILCLSTSKWIHLNYGDIGVKILFYNIYKQLAPGGLFIFEFQNWKSYKKRRNLTPLINSNFSEIKLKPESFKEYLESTYGYECLEVITPPSNFKIGFQRPIYIFRKQM